MSGADKIILRQLNQLGLHWDEEVVYQSKRLECYQAALEKLESKNYTFACCCTRKELGNSIYPGTCRDGLKTGQQARSIRLKSNNSNIVLQDKLQGEYSQCINSEVGDFVIKRADGYFAYHLATVIDDAYQNITEVVRGIDLLESTPRQIYTQQLLELPTPNYLHLPMAIDSSGKKISKSDYANSVSNTKNIEVLYKALVFLNLSPPEQLLSANVEEIIKWSIENWDIAKLPKEKEIIYTQD